MPAALVDGGDVELRPANEHATVVPMATSIGPSAPVYVVNNAAGSKTAFSPINQGAGQVAWFGVDSDEAVDRLRFIRDAVGPVLAEAITSNGPIDAFALASQGVPMGDDVHMRVQATTNLLLRDLLPHLVRSTHAEAGAVATFLSGEPPHVLERGDGRSEVTRHVGGRSTQLQHRHHDGAQRRHLWGSPPRQR